MGTYSAEDVLKGPNGLDDTSEIAARLRAFAIDGATPLRSNSIKFFPSLMMLMVTSYGAGKYFERTRAKATFSNEAMEKGSEAGSGTENSAMVVTCEYSRIINPAKLGHNPFSLETHTAGTRVLGHWVSLTSSGKCYPGPPVFMAGYTVPCEQYQCPPSPPPSSSPILYWVVLLTWVLTFPDIVNNRAMSSLSHKKCQHIIDLKLGPNVPLSWDDDDDQRPRAGRQKTRFWRLQTLASRDFDLSRLTERQQMAYIAAQASGFNPLLSSPFRIDRILARGESSLGSSDIPPQAIQHHKRKGGELTAEEWPITIDDTSLLLSNAVEHSSAKQPSPPPIAVSTESLGLDPKGLRARLDLFEQKVQEIRREKEGISRRWSPSVPQL